MPTVTWPASERPAPQPRYPVPGTGRPLPSPAQKVLSPRAPPSSESQSVLPQLWTSNKIWVGAGINGCLFLLDHFPPNWGSRSCQGQLTSQHPYFCFLGLRDPPGPPQKDGQQCGQRPRASAPPVYETIILHLINKGRSPTMHGARSRSCGFGRNYTKSLPSRC